MRVVAWLGLVASGVVFSACGVYTNLGDGPLGGAGGEDDGSGGSSTMSGGSGGKGSAGTTGMAGGSPGTGGSTGTAGRVGMAGSVGMAGGGGDTGVAGSVGMAGTGGSGTTPIDYCANRPCGSLCPINGGFTDMTDGQAGQSSDAAAPALLGYCAADGSCGPAFPMCPNTLCMSDGDCPAIPTPCQVCADGSYSCSKNACVNGACVLDAPGCGNACETSMDCSILDAPCQMCSDGSTSCPKAECVMGRCVESVPGCGQTNPCEGRACGEQCNPCPAGDMNCSPLAVLSFCNDQGTCQTSVPTCGAKECMSAADCPLTDVCYMCANGGCGGVDCVNGRCKHGCPDDPVECMVTEDCGTPPPICQECGDGSCAQMTCVTGACRMVCGQTM